MLDEKRFEDFVDGKSSNRVSEIGLLAAVQYSAAHVVARGVFLLWMYIIIPLLDE